MEMYLLSLNTTFNSALPILLVINTKFFLAAFKGVLKFNVIWAGVILEALNWIEELLDILGGIELLIDTSVKFSPNKGTAPFGRLICFFWNIRIVTLKFAEKYSAVGIKTSKASIKIVISFIFFAGFLNFFFGGGLWALKNAFSILCILIVVVFIKRRLGYNIT